MRVLINIALISFLANTICSCNIGSTQQEPFTLIIITAIDECNEQPLSGVGIDVSFHNGAGDWSHHDITNNEGQITIDMTQPGHSTFTFDGSYVSSAPEGYNTAWINNDDFCDIRLENRWDN